MRLDIYAYLWYYNIRKEVNTVSKRKKKKGGKAQPDTLNLTAAILNLITAILLLIEKLTE